MSENIFTNKDIVLVTGITERQALSWSAQGLVIPFLEARGAGCKRGYSSVNLVEFGIAEQLFSMGHGVQSAKRILSDLRYSKILERWVRDQGKFFREYYKMHGGMFTFLPDTESPKKMKVIKALEESFHEVFYIESYRSEEISGVLFYFFGGRFNRRAIIVPEIKSSRNQKLSRALKYIYNMLCRHDSVIILNIGQVRRKIDEILKSRS